MGWFKPFFPHLMANRFFSTIQQHLAAKEFATMEANLLHLLFSGINGVIYCIAYVCKHATHSRLSASAKLVADAATFHSVPPFPTAWKQNWITCSRFLVFASPLLGRVQIRTRYRWVWNHTSSIVSNFLSSVFDLILYHKIPTSLSNWPCSCLLQNKLKIMWLSCHENWHFGLLSNQFWAQG